MDHIFLTARFLIGIVFAVSLTAKFRAGGWGTFLESIEGLAPRLPARATAVVVALVEAGAIATLVIPDAAAYGLMAAALLLVSFTIALLRAIRRRSSVSCGCFGTSETPVGKLHVARNVLLTAGACAGIAASVQPAAGAPGWQGSITAAAVGSVAAVMAVLTDEMADLFRTRS
ncbi:MauE/DoxX family redox-associated membrane protein [Streptomyces flavofungini]|uniref:MauE/DoxX family redox-associated membrane protein n=1 Tax=Streptomyces flavofungini TaxID=68200 RepID=UPI0034DF91EA